MSLELYDLLVGVAVFGIFGFSFIVYMEKFENKISKSN